MDTQSYTTSIYIYNANFMGEMSYRPFGLARNASYYVYCTKLALKYSHSLFCIPASAGCPKQDFQPNFIRVLRPDMTFWVWFSK